MPTQITREMLVDYYNEFKKGNLEYINRPISFRTQLPKYIYPHTRYRAI